MSVIASVFQEMDPLADLGKPSPKLLLVPLGDHDLQWLPHLLKSPVGPESSPQFSMAALLRYPGTGQARSVTTDFWTSSMPPFKAAPRFACLALAPSS